MAAVPVPPARRSLIGAVLGAFERRSQARTRQPSRLVAAVRENVMTFAGLAAVTVGMFHLGAVAGWAAVGVSLFLADFKLQG